MEENDERLSEASKRLQKTKNREDGIDIKLSEPNKIVENELVTLHLNRTKFFMAFGAMFLLMAYSFWEGVLPVIVTGEINSIAMKTYNKLPFFVVSSLVLLIFPMIIIPALMRNGTVTFFTDKVILYRSIGGSCVIKYSSMYTKIYNSSILILNGSDTYKSSHFNIIIRENTDGIVVPISMFILNTCDVYKAIDILKTNSKTLINMRTIKQQGE